MLDLEYVLVSLLLVYTVACLPWWSAHPENSLEVRDLLEREKSYNDQLTEFEKKTGLPLDPDSRQCPRAKVLAENEDMVRTHPKLDEDMRSAMMMVIRGYKINGELAKLRARLAELGALHLSRKRISIEQAQGVLDPPLKMEVPCDCQSQASCRSKRVHCMDI